MVRVTISLNTYAFRKIPVFLGNENKKFMISKIEKGKKGREYVGVVDWLVSSGIVNISYCLDDPSLPLKGHYNPDNFRFYFMDTGALAIQFFKRVEKYNLLTK